MKVVSYPNLFINDQYKDYRQERSTTTLQQLSVVLLSEVLDWASLPVHNYNMVDRLSVQDAHAHARARLRLRLAKVNTQLFTVFKVSYKLRPI